MAVDWNEPEPYGPHESWFYPEEDGEEGLLVSRKCPQCGRYLKCGGVYAPLPQYEGEPKFIGFACRKHGVVKPDWTRGVGGQGDGKG